MQDGKIRPTPTGVNDGDLRDNRQLPALPRRRQQVVLDISRGGMKVFLEHEIPTLRPQRIFSPEDLGNAIGSASSRAMAVRSWRTRKLTAISTDP